MTKDWGKTTYCTCLDDHTWDAVTWACVKEEVNSGCAEGEVIDRYTGYCVTKDYCYNMGMEVVYDEVYEVYTDPNDDTNVGGEGTYPGDY